jgi:microcystin-dependent protein
LTNILFKGGFQLEPYLGELRLFPWAFAPKGWSLCQGQILPVQQFQALFSILGVQYGGNGSTTFALPDLRGRVPVHFGNTYTIGQAAGEATHTLTTDEMPNHNHQVNASTVIPTESSPANAYWTTNENSYSATSNGTMNQAAIATAGGSQPHSNTQPYLVLNYCIAITGIFPSRG